MANRGTFQICYDPECREQTPHGTIVLPNGADSPPAHSQERARMLLEGGVRHGVVSPDDRAALEAEIRQSGLPEEMTNADRSRLAAIQEFESPESLLAALMSGGPMEVLAIEISGGEMRTIGVGTIEAVPKEATKSAGLTGQGFEIEMPEACPLGCHRVHLYRDGKLVAEGTVRTAKEARNLVNGWRQEYGISWYRTRQLRTKAVETTGRYNAELAARRN